MNRDAGSHAFDRAYWMTDSTTRHASPESRQRCQSFLTALVIACASDSSWRRVSVSRWRRTSFNAPRLPRWMFAVSQPIANSRRHSSRFFGNSSANNAARGAAQSIVLVLVQKDRALARHDS